MSLKTSTSRTMVVGGAMLLAVVLAACSGGDTTTGPSSGTPPDTITVSGALVDSVGAAFDAHVAAGDDLYVPIGQILGGLVPPLSAAPASAVDSIIDNGIAVSLDQQYSDLAEAFRENVLYTVDNFVSAAAASGATVRATGAPLDRATLTALLTPTVQASRYTVPEILPGTVIAISRARAKREGITSSDPVWGDGFLDPLQATLLMYAVDYAGTVKASTSADVLASRASRLPPANYALRDEGGEGIEVEPWGKEPEEFIKDQAIDAALDYIGEEIGMPLTKKEALKATVCASVILNSYKFDLKESQHDLWHKDPAAPQHPFSSTITAHLRFDFKPYNAASAVTLQKLGCVLPPVGDATGKEISWSIDDSLQKHGSLTDQQVVTDGSGNAQATYQTIAEIVPHILQQSLAKNTTGTYQVRATHLLDEKWSTFEKLIGVGVLNPTDAGGRLFVNYYEMPKSIELKGRVTLNGTGTGEPYNYSGTGDFDVVMPLVPPGAKAFYTGTGPATYENFTFTPQNPDSGCLETVTGTTNGGMLATLAPDTSAAGNVSLYLGLTVPPPTEHYNDPCSGAHDFGRLWYTWLNHDEKSPFGSFQVVAPGHLQRVIDESYPDPLQNVVEHLTLDLLITP